jgi:7,8-dihydroneopterin aldolase/epimerase/oxygenase
MDFIFIRELRLPAWIGVYKYEKLAQQMIELDLEIAVPASVFATGRIQDTIDYGAAARRIKSVLAEERFGLVEKLAERVAQLLLDEFKAPRVKVSVTKLGVLRDARRVGATIERSR